MGHLTQERLAASPLAELHAYAKALGIERFRLLRKPELARAIVAARDRRRDAGGPGAPHREVGISRA
jgi:hypothetical protein